MVLDGHRVLLIEDDFLIQMDLAETLQGQGAEVTVAASVHDGLIHAEAEFDAAVLDIRLPDGEVFPVAEKLVERDTPVIFHSGNVDSSTVAQRFPNSIALSKPVHERRLIEAVRQTVAKRRT